MNFLREDPLITIVALAAVIVLAITFYLALAKPSWAGDYDLVPAAESQTEEWTPLPIETYYIPIDTGTGRILRMYDPNGRTTCLVWMTSKLGPLPLGCVEGQR